MRRNNADVNRNSDGPLRQLPAKDSSGGLQRHQAAAGRSLDSKEEEQVGGCCFFTLLASIFGWFDYVVLASALLMGTVLLFLVSFRRLCVSIPQCLVAVGLTPSPDPQAPKRVLWEARWNVVAGYNRINSHFVLFFKFGGIRVCQLVSINSRWNASATPSFADIFSRKVRCVELL